MASVKDKKRSRDAVCHEITQHQRLEEVKRTIEEKATGFGVGGDDL